MGILLVLFPNVKPCASPMEKIADMFHIMVKHVLAIPLARTPDVPTTMKHTSDHTLKVD